MFTGLINGIGSLGRAQSVGNGLRLEVRHTFTDGPLALGESVAVDGCCLTVSAILERAFLADLSSETLHRTGGRTRWRAGREVNLERALALGDRMGGHYVQGHVDGLCRIAAVRKESSGGATLSVVLGREAEGLVASKGSIALDGVSLTVARLRGSTCELAVIPETWKRTTLSMRRPGDFLTVEYDVLARYARGGTASSRT